MNNSVTNSKKTILVVDDNVDMLETTVQLLRILGFNTLQATNGEEGLKILEAGSKIDLILTDVVMPGPVRSIDLAEHAREIDSTIKVIYATGYGDTSKMLVGEIANIIEKPFEFDKLSAIINQIIGS